MQLLDGSIASRSLRRMEADQEQRHRCKIHLLPSEFSGPALPPEMRHPPADTSSACAHALLGRLLLLYIYIYIYIYIAPSALPCKQASRLIC